ncbi:tape measure protein [Bacillus chungangensis]|uniref:Tape measure domain-containing protein n=1 Tax=Bacillus chungangensis TaxID=587633 RepID=A0ABT9WS32_9BACI|nr:tape measure protein [Bacillus chungangensis]MDQ0175981.1 tape measure domain-containing protein [Bacillus chungangensis]
MATVTSTLKMFDSFSGPLKNITQSMNIMLSSMESLHRSVDRNNNIGKQFDVARQKIAQANAEINKMTQSISSAEKEQKKLNNQFNKGAELASNIGKKLLAVAATYSGFRAVKDTMSDLISTGVNFHAFRQDSSVAFNTFFGDAKKAQKYMDDMLDFAKTTPFSYPDLLTAGRNMVSFGMEAKNTLPVLQAIGDATKGMGGGAQKLMDIANVFGSIQVSGRLSLGDVNRFHDHGIPALRMLANQAGVTAEEMEKQIQKGVIGANTAIAWLVDGIKNGTDGLEGATAKFGGLMKASKGNWSGAIDSLRSAWRNAGAEITKKHMPKITDGVYKLIDIIKKMPEALGPWVDVFGGVFGYTIKSLQIVLPIMLKIVNIIGMIVNAVGKLWPILEPILIGLATVLLPLIIIKLGIIVSKMWAMVAPAVSVAAAWLGVTWPILLVAGAITTVIWVLNAFGLKTEQITGFVGGLFASLFALIYNGIAITWNAMLALAEFIANVFIDPTYAVKKLAHDMAKFFVDRMYNMALSAENFANAFSKTVLAAIDGVIIGINMLIKAMNHIPGFNIPEIGIRVSDLKQNKISNTFKKVSNALDATAPKSDKKVKDFSKYRMEEKNIYDAFKKGKDIATGALDKTKSPKPDYDMPEFGSDMLDPLGLGKEKGNKGKHGNKPNIGKVDRVGKIDDTVDISSEDLKVMRDLAEMKSIQNFVTLTPTVEVNTGDINNGYDIDTIIRRIEKSLEEEIASAAKGVYS